MPKGFEQAPHKRAIQMTYRHKKKCVQHYRSLGKCIIKPLYGKFKRLTIPSVGTAVEHTDRRVSWYKHFETLFCGTS